MIIRLSLSAICAFFSFGVATAAVQNAVAQDERRACPTISVSCPPDFKEGQPISFMAKVSGGNPNVIPTYDWTVSGGKIIHGQGSPSIRVDTGGFSGQARVASVRVSGFDLACLATASCSFIIEPPLNPIKFDSHGTLPRRQEVARLSDFAAQLKNQPGVQGYLLIYGGRRGRAGEAQKMAARSQKFLTKMHGIDPRRIVTVDGGFKERLTIDLWLVPTGVNPPLPEPTVAPSEVNIAKPVRRKPSKR